MNFSYGTREHWEQVARTRLPHGSAASEAMESSMLEAARGVEGKRVLDVGTGSGRLSIALARLGARAVGIDVTPTGIELAKENARQQLGEQALGERVEFCEMDAAELQFGASTFEFVMCLKTIWCLPQPERCLAEFARVLAPGGKLIIQIYGEQAECPLLLLGPRMLGELTKSLELPKDQLGPFDFTPEVLFTSLSRAGFRQPRFDAYAIEAELSGSNAYWQTLRSLAGSAYYAYTLLAESHAAALEGAWQRRADRLRDEHGTVRLGLSWLVCSAEKAQ